MSDKPFIEWFPPGCRARHCTIHMTYDIVAMRRVIQHNDRPEAVLLIDDFEIRRIERLPPLTWQETYEMEMAQRLLRWTERVHAYEEGRECEPWMMER